MPESPEAYILSKYIEKLFLNKKITGITSNTKTKVDIPIESEIIECNSYGKIIIIVTKDFYMHIHLGITGWFVPKKPRIFKYIFHFSKKDIYLQDTRRFSSIKILNRDEHLNHLSKYGVNILSESFTSDIFYKTLSVSNRNICSILMDQKIFSGIGNYIKNEALYLAEISPYRKSSSIPELKILNLWSAIRFVSFSNLVDWHNDYKVKLSEDIKKILPEYLEVPYKYYVFEREKDIYKNKVIFDKKHCGRRTFYVKEIQK